MTTQPQPAGWYPDPTVKRGQKYWDGNEWEQDLGPAPEAQPRPLPETQAFVDHARQQSPGNGHLYKNPVLYAIGGLFFPPLVLFLMGGSRATCAWMAGLWVLFWITIWFFGIGVIFALAVDSWSVMACYQEAVKQNKALGLA
ncbi:DUF2510 domain-containing protein [Mycobacterium sp.]|uniref:DUF2510 domain-containing protein n=1 Tax=Mycobacterium sp. TaxID=1785 RepID=UPI003BAE9347